jgi:hypothetical protein
VDHRERRPAVAPAGILARRALGVTAVDRTDAWIYGNPGFLAGTSNGRTWTRLTASRRVGTTGRGTRWAVGTAVVHHGCR